MLVSRLASSLDRKRFRPIVCLYWPGWLKDKCSEQDLETHVLHIGGMFDWRWIWNFRRLVKEKDVALIHAHEFTANTYGTLVARMVGIPLIATVHGKNYYVDQVKRRVAYRMVSRYACMVAVSEDLKRFIVENVGVAPERIHVVYNGVNPGSRMSLDERDSLKAKLGLSNWDHIVGMVGSLYPVKAHSYLLKAIPRVLSVCPRTRFLLIGRGELESSLKREAKELGIEEQVQFLGFRSDVPSLLSVMDIFVLPSLSEGLSVALLEAMAAGIPTIATRVGGNPELVVDQKTGFLIPPRDSEALASKLLLLLQDKARSRTLGENGRKRVEDQFSFEAMVRNYEQLYEQNLTRIPA